MKTFVETERLILREWSRKDLPVFTKMNNDPTVMKFFPYRLTKAESSDFMTRIVEEIDIFDYGIFAVEERESGRFVGFAGIHRFDFGADFLPGVELTVRLIPDVWNKGYATEAGEAILSFAKEYFGMGEIYAFTSCLNKPAERLMQKLKMKRIGEFDHPALPSGHALQRHVLYCTIKPDHKKRSAFGVADPRNKSNCDAVVIFVNGYWNNGRKMLRIGSRLSHKLSVDIKESIARSMADVPLEGYWGDGFTDAAKRYFRNHFTNISGKSIRSLASIFVDGSGDWNSSGHSRFENGQIYGREMLMQELEGLGVTDDKGGQKKSVFIVSHSMGGAYAEGIVDWMSSVGLKPEMVLHFSPADNNDFRVTMPELTYQINFSPDFVLFYKNTGDRIVVRAENILESIKETVGGTKKKNKPDVYQIQNLPLEHYIEYDNGLDFNNHTYTKSKEVWEKVDFLKA